MTGTPGEKLSGATFRSRENSITNPATTRLDETLAWLDEVIGPRDPEPAVEAPPADAHGTPGGAS